MNKNMKNILNNPWLVAIFAPLLGGSISTIWISITNKTNLKDSFIIVLNFIKNILNYKVPIWSIVVFTLFFIIFLIIKNKVSSKLLNIHEHPDWYYNFKNMYYKNWYFSWDYQIYSNIYELKDLKPICSCGCNLVKKRRIGNIHYGTSVLQCPNCEKIYDTPDTDTITELSELIQYKIKNNSYKQEA